MEGGRWQMKTLYSMHCIFHAIRTCMYTPCIKCKHKEMLICGGGGDDGDGDGNNNNGSGNDNDNISSSSNSSSSDSNSIDSGTLHTHLVWMDWLFVDALVDSSVFGLVIRVRLCGKHRFVVVSLFLVCYSRVNKCRTRISNAFQCIIRCI